VRQAKKGYLDIGEGRIFSLDQSQITEAGKNVRQALSGIAPRGNEPKMDNRVPQQNPDKLIPCISRCSVDSCCNHDLTFP